MALGRQGLRCLELVGLFECLGAFGSRLPRCGMTSMFKRGRLGAATRQSAIFSRSDDPLIDQGSAKDPASGHRFHSDLGPSCCGSTIASRQTSFTFQESIRHITNARLAFDWLPRAAFDELSRATGTITKVVYKSSSQASSAPSQTRHLHLYRHAHPRISLLPCEEAKGASDIRRRRLQRSSRPQSRARRHYTRAVGAQHDGAASAHGDGQVLPAGGRQSP